MSTCLICNTSIEPFISFGKMPIANGFLESSQYQNEYFFDLSVAACPGCHMVQLTELVDPAMMFHENYAFFSSTSRYMAVHFASMADWIRETYIESSDPFIIEIGSNDGIMLRNFASRGYRHLGIEPSSNVAQVAIDNGIDTVCEFFTQDLARKIVQEHGYADAFIGANVMCHIPDLHAVAAGIKLSLKPKGVLAFEDPYLGDIVSKTSYDQIYDEHVYYFSATSIKHLFSMHDLELIDVIPQTVHGGSMRYVLAHPGSYPVSEAVHQWLEREDDLGIKRPETYEQLRGQIEQSRDMLMATLNQLKAEGKRVVGYGATSKSTTVTNYCGITSDLVEYISDTTPIKQGKFSPGAHIPVRPYEAFQEDYPDIALLFAWNHAAEIMEKEGDFRHRGGKWLTYVPTVRITE